MLNERGDGGAEHVGSADLLELRGELLVIASGVIAADRADELVGAAAGIAIAGRHAPKANCRVVLVSGRWHYPPIQVDIVAFHFAMTTTPKLGAETNFEPALIARKRSPVTGWNFGRSGRRAR